MNRIIEVFFIKDYKAYVLVYGKKNKNEYILNINKLIKEKIGSDYLIPNKTQAFLLNYEIRKLVDKVINSKSKKYTRIIYFNNNISKSGIMNAFEFLEYSYPTIEFNSTVLDTENEFDEIEKAKIIKS